MTTADKPQICGAIDEPEYSLWFECELPPGHAGDHEGTYTWTNEPHGPKPPPTPNRFVSAAWAESLQTAYAKMISQQLAMAVQGSPFVDGDRVMQVINRDQF